MQGLTLRPRAEGDAGRDPARAAPSDGLPASPGAPALRVRTTQPSRLGREAAGSAAEAAASPHGPSPRERNAFFSADPPPAPPPLDLDLDQDQGGPSLLGPSPPPPPPSTGPRRSGMRTRTSLGGGGAPKPRRDVCFAAAIEVRRRTRATAPIAPRLRE